MLLKNKQNFSRKGGGKKKRNLIKQNFQFHSEFPYTEPCPSSRKQDF